jgi:hypothetical protein
MPSYHFPFSASASKRWTECHRSYQLCKGRENKSTFFAKEGTAAHELGERCLLNGANAEDYLGQVIQVEGDDFKVDYDMADAVQVYLDTVRSVLEEYPGAELRVEHQFALEFIHPELGGTCDAIIVVPFHKVIVLDYKHGKGVVVAADENTQAKIYALGAAVSEDLEDIEVVIVQPRAYAKGDGVKRWNTTKSGLMQWAEHILKPATIEASTNPNARFKTGDWCRFCSASPICPEARKTVNKNAQVAFDDGFFPVVSTPVLPLPEDMTPAQISKMVQFAEYLKPWIDNIKDYAYRGLHEGRLVPGEDGFEYKLVQGKPGNRKYADDDKAMAVLTSFLKQEAYERPKLKSPAQAEKALAELGREGKVRGVKSLKEAKAVLAGITMRPEGKLAMVPMQDDRPAIRKDVQAVFEAEPLPAALGVEAVSPDDF